MRQKAIIGGLLLIAVGVVLGATVFRTDIAQATGLAQSVIVANTTTNPVPVKEQNLDGRNIRVHEEGTANVNVTNSSVLTTAAAVTGGGGKLLMGAGVPLIHSFDPPQSATALSIAFHDEARALTFTYKGSVVADFWGPYFFGADTVALALNRPITFDRIECAVGGALDTCNVSWIGSEP